MIGIKYAIFIKHNDNIPKQLKRRIKMFIIGIWIIMTASFTLPTLMLIDGLKINK